MSQSSHLDKIAKGRESMGVVSSKTLDGKPHQWGSLLLQMIGHKRTVIRVTGSPWREIRWKSKMNTILVYERLFLQQKDNHLYN